MDRSLVIAKELRKHFPISKGFFGRSTEFVHAVDGVNLWINEGETVGVVGESGCGKTTLGKCLVRLAKPTSGEIIFDGFDISKTSEKNLRTLRSKMQLVFQDPFSSLNPRMLAKDIVAEGLKIHKICKKNEIEEKVLELLSMVGLSKDHLYRFPHEFSGGQRQRIAIARALALNPKFLILDEPTASLDVSVQAQILNMLKSLQEKLKLTYLFISHDMSVIKFMSDRIAVMYLGKIVEIASSSKLFEEQKHPYSKALMSAILVPNPHMARAPLLLEGDPPSPVDLPSGCRFHPRCPLADSICKKVEPDLKDIGDRFVACHFA